MLNTGEARDWPKLVTIDGVDVEIDRLFAAGDTDRWLNTAEYVVHPPVGKWMIAAGLKLFGGADNPQSADRVDCRPARQFHHGVRLGSVFADVDASRLGPCTAATAICD